jgi:AraC-like DNA-binding protein
MHKAIMADKEIVNMSTTAELINNFPEIANGPTESPLEGVLFFKETTHIPRKPIVYPPGIAIVVQGHKIVYLGGRQFQYDANNYLVTTVTMPTECETFGSPEKPLMGLYIDIDMGQLHDLIGRVDLHSKMNGIGEKTLPRAIGPASMDEAMADAVLRLLKALHSETEAQILGPGLVREILYRVLCGSQAPVLYSLAMYSGTFSQIAKALKIIQSEYAKKIDVEQLAKTVHMSSSAFHRAFKEITLDSPMQYLKKIRLTKAKALMVQENMKAYSVAYSVGYESPSQFSREFKRYFGQSPAEMTRELRTCQG